jgi:F420-dependent oxidoreductase-like protein
VRVATQLSYADGFVSAVDRIADLERRGLDLVWVAEAYGFDAVSLMGYIAARTEAVHIGAGILPLFTRTPTLLAMTAAGVDALSGGRAVLGLGASGPQVIEGFHGVPYDKPLARTREIVAICRAVWRRDAPLTNAGPLYPIPLPAEHGTGLGKPLKIIAKPVRPSIPVWVASLGDKNVELTAEVADGWLPLFFLPERAGDVFGPALQRGAANRPADLGPLEIAAGGVGFIGSKDDARRVLDRFARPVAALYLGGMGAVGHNFYNDLACRYGYADAAREVQELYLSGRKDEAAARIPDDFLELTNLCGTEGFVKERVDAYRAAGVTVLNVIPADTDAGRAADLVERLKAWAM